MPDRSTAWSPVNVACRGGQIAERTSRRTPPAPSGLSRMFRQPVESAVAGAAAVDCLIVQSVAQDGFHVHTQRLFHADQACSGIFPCEAKRASDAPRLRHRHRERARRLPVRRRQLLATTPAPPVTLVDSTGYPASPVAHGGHLDSQIVAAALNGRNSAGTIGARFSSVVARRRSHGPRLGLPRWRPAAARTFPAEWRRCRNRRPRRFQPPRRSGHGPKWRPRTSGPGATGCAARAAHARRNRQCAPVRSARRAAPSRCAAAITRLKAGGRAAQLGHAWPIAARSVGCSVSGKPLIVATRALYSFRALG